MELGEILGKIEASRDDIVDTMCGMISIPAISPEAGGNGEAARADYLMGKLGGFDSVQRIDVPHFDDPTIMRPNILAKKNGKKRGTVWIIAHTDTVPAGDLDKWDTDPFTGVYRDGRVYGRGTEDNGQSVISSIFASKFIEKGTLEGMSLGIALVADEEMASSMGICHLIDENCFDPADIFVVPDWGSPGGSCIEVNEKSLIWLRFDIEGRACHASTPDKGANALRAGCRLMGGVLEDLEHRFGDSDQIFTPPASSFEPTKCTVASENVNTVPGEWSFNIDARVLPKYNLDDVLAAAQRIGSMVSKETGAVIKVSEVQRHVSGGSSSVDSPAYKALSDAVESVTGRAPKAVGVGGATCANFFRQKGYDAYVWQTGGGTLHAPNEYVEIDNLLTDTKVFATLFYNLCVKGRAAIRMCRVRPIRGMAAGVMSWQ